MSARPTRLLTKEQRQLAEQLLPADLFSNADIAREVQCSERTIRRYRARWEVTGELVQKGRALQSGHHKLLPMHEEVCILKQADVWIYV